MATSSLITGGIQNGNDSNSTLKLLEILQAAIANGEHEKAAQTAGTLARLKVNFNLKEVDHLAPKTHHYPTSTLDVHIEDQPDVHETTSLKIDSSMTIGELEMKILDEYKVPIHNKRLVFVKPLTSIPENKVTVPDNQSRNSISAETISLPSTSAEWQCSSCTLINPISEKFCGACDRSKIQAYDLDNYENNIESCRWMNENAEQETPEKKWANYQELVNMEKNDLITNLEDFECPTCLTTYFPGDGVILKACLHTFCRDCLSQLILHNTDAEIKCPYIDDDYSCESILQEREIKALVSEEEYEKYLAKSVTQAESKIQNTFHCRTTDCKSWCIVEDEVNSFHCPVCDKVNCLTCQVIHTSLNCKQYQEIITKDSATNEDAKKTKLKLETMLKKGEAMTCSTCHVIIIKKIGCDGVTCTMCGTSLCWATKGARWGPKGPGDISGGCRCGVNGKKCHPKCHGCH